MSFRLLSPFLRKSSPLLARISRLQRRTIKTVETEVKDEPIKYSTSKAGQWKAVYTTSGKDYFEAPKSQSTFIMLSLTAFMIYFCILREENDLDDWMRDIENRVPLKLEEGHLRAKIERGKRENTDVSSYEMQLQSIQKIQENAKLSKDFNPFKRNQ